MVTSKSNAYFLDPGNAARCRPGNAQVHIRYTGGAHG